jgi:hypothetical protein
VHLAQRHAVGTHAYIRRHGRREALRDHANGVLNVFVRLDKVRRATSFEGNSLEHCSLHVGTNAEREHAVPSAAASSQLGETLGVPLAHRGRAVSQEQHDAKPPSSCLDGQRGFERTRNIR